MLPLGIQLLGAAIFTIGIEGLILIPRFLPCSLSKKKLITNIILINIITNIILNLMLAAVEILAAGRMNQGVRLGMIIIGELLIPLVEAYMYEMGEVQLARKHVIAICYLANILSFGIGVIGGMMI